MIFCLLLLLLPLAAFGQSLDAGGMGRAGAHDLFVKAGSVLNWNPAVLGRSKLFKWSIELPSLSASAANNAFSVSFWNENLAGDQFFTAAEKAEILDRIPDSGWRANVLGSIPALGFTYNRFGLHAILEAAGYASAPRDVIRLAFLGNELNRNYDILDFTGDGQVYADYSAGFGYAFEQGWIPELTFGAGFHFYHGFALNKIVRAEGGLAFTDTTVTGSGVIHQVRSTAGDGVGFDLGTVAVFSDKWQAGLAFRQIGARMTWQVKENHRISFYTDSTGINTETAQDNDNLEEALHWQDTTYEGGAVETNLSPVIQINGRYQPHAKWSVLGDVSARLQESVKGPAGLDAAIGGIYHTLPWLIVQGGIGAGNLWGAKFGVGTGLRFKNYEMDAGWSWNGGFFNQARGVAFGVTQRLQF